VTAPLVAFLENKIFGVSLHIMLQNQIPDKVKVFKNFKNIKKI
jgi:hypothetical protein